MGAEYELKFASSPQVQQRIAAQYPGGTRIFMESTYYDTPCGRLSERRYTLRRRLENGSSVCTVKTPLEGFGRGEWETEEESIEKAIDKLCALGAPADLRTMTRDGIQPICGAQFTRLAIPVKTDAFCAELALDEGILTGGTRQIPLCETELEYKSGDMSAFLAFADEFSARYSLKTEPLSKFRRALNLYLGEK